MRKLIVAVLGASLLMTVAAPVHAAPDRSSEITRGTTFSWTGSTATGFNYYYWDPVGAGDTVIPHTLCTKSATFYCDTILAEFTNPLTPEEIEQGIEFKSAQATVIIDTFTPTQGPITDFDLLAYESDASGTLGPLIESDGNLTNTTSETVSFSIETDVATPSKWVLIHVVYYQVVNGSYKGRVTFG